MSRARTIATPTSCRPAHQTNRTATNPNRTNRTATETKPDQVSDEGGGIPRSGLSRIFSYLYSTAKSPVGHGGEAGLHFSWQGGRGGGPGRRGGCISTRAGCDWSSHGHHLFHRELHSRPQVQMDDEMAESGGPAVLAGYGYGLPIRCALHRANYPTRHETDQTPTRI
jgi:hypothetical protein